MRKEKDYDMTLEHKNLSNRVQIVDQFLAYLRIELFSAIADNDEEEISRLDKRISELKNPGLTENLEELEQHFPIS